MALGQFGDIGIGRTRHLVMDVVKFTDPGESRLQHLHIGLRRHPPRCRRRSCGRRSGYITSRQVPETIGGIARCDFSEAGHAALKGVTVQIGYAGKSDRMTLIAGLRQNAGLDADEPAGIDRDPDIASPALRSSACSKNSPATHPSPTTLSKLWTASRPL